MPMGDPDGAARGANLGTARVVSVRRVAGLAGRAPVRQPDGQMNKTEAAYAARLALRKQVREIADYWYEPITLKLAHDCRLTMDFLVQLMDGTLELHDTKARWSNRATAREDALIKMRVAARLFPFRMVQAVWERDKTWTLIEIKP